jgi:hypothetical protein
MRTASKPSFGVLSWLLDDTALRPEFPTGVVDPLRMKPGIVWAPGSKEG